MKNRHKKSLAATSLALVISASGAVTSLALPQAAPDQEFTEAYQRLYDNQMDYDELEDLVKNFYPPIKNTYDTYYNTYEEEQAGIVNSMFEAAREMDDAADDLEDAMKSGALSAADAMGDLMVAKATAKGYRSGAQSMGYNIELGIREDNKNLKQIQRGVNKIVYSLQQAMNGYEQLMVNRDVAAKGVEIAETARNIQQTMQAQGLAIDADVISAASSLTSARSQLAALDTQAESIKKTLCTFTGWGSDGNPVIGTVPTSDVAAWTRLSRSYQRTPPRPRTRYATSPTAKTWYAPISRPFTTPSWKRKWNMIPPQPRGRRPRIHGRQPRSSTGQAA